MFSKDLQGQGHRKADPAQEQLARRWAAQYGHPAPPAGKSFADHYGAPGPAGVDLVDGADLDVAVAAGQRAQAEGYGSRRCGSCPGCTYGGTCRRPPSLAMVRLKAAQTVSDQVDQAEAALVDLQRAAFQWERAHGRLL